MHFKESPAPLFLSVQISMFMHQICVRLVLKNRSLRKKLSVLAVGCYKKWQQSYFEATV